MPESLLRERARVFWLAATARFDSCYRGIDYSQMSDASSYSARLFTGGNQTNILTLGNGRAARKFPEERITDVLQVLDADLAGIEAVAG